MRYHIEWSYDSQGRHNIPPVCSSHHDDINRCHQALAQTLAVYPKARGIVVEECSVIGKK